jgi:hypothetical protein
LPHTIANTLTFDNIVINFFALSFSPHEHAYFFALFLVIDASFPRRIRPVARLSVVAGVFGGLPIFGLSNFSTSLSGIYQTLPRASSLA